MVSCRSWRRGKLSLVSEAKNMLSKLEIPTLDLLDQGKEKEPEPVSAAAWVKGGVLAYVVRLVTRW